MPKKESQPTSRTAAANAARRIPQGTVTRQYQAILSIDIAATFKAMNTTDRGIAMERGLSPEFPWPEFDRLQKFEAAVKTAQNNLGE
mgnify:CR=1 FL=1